MRVDLVGSGHLLFTDGSPVRAASAVVRLGDAFLVAQDDATHAACWSPRDVTRLRLLPPVDGLDVFSEAAGTKHLKPDLEAACEVRVGDGAGALLLGSGSAPARRRGCLVSDTGDGPSSTVADLGPLYDALAAALGLADGDLNVEGACVVGEALRVFSRGIPAGGVPSASADVALADVLRAFTTGEPLRRPQLQDVRRYDVGDVDGIGLAVTDAVTVGDLVLLSAAAEDTPNAVDDGPVAGSVLLLVDGAQVLGRADLPAVAGEALKVEGLAVRQPREDGVDLVAVVDADEAQAPSAHLDLRVTWG